MKKKNILIVADSNNEPAKLIKQWLVSLNVNFVSIDTERDLFKISHFDITSNTFGFFIGNEEYSSSDFDAFYFHRGALRLPNRLGIRANRENYSDINNAFCYYITGYENTVMELTNIMFSQKNVIGWDNGGRVNKVKMLIYAKQAGFNIPKTLVTTQKHELIKFLKSVKSIITKSMDSNLTFFDTVKSKMIHNLTTELNISQIEKLPDTFPLSIFQENINKFVELRVFFFKDEVFASAILSQNTDNTKQDYRNYDFNNPNRVVPFKLPKSIISKLKYFQSLSNLKTGSIDLLVNKKGEYYFLEINPQGQFIGVSNYCNYKLEKIVAQMFN